MLGYCTPSETVVTVNAYLVTVFDIGQALGAVVAGALSTILNIPGIFKLASLIILTGVFIVTLIQTSDKAS